MDKLKKMLGAVLISILLGSGLTAYGAEFFVAKERGDNQNPGTKAAPFRNIEAALKAARPAIGSWWPRAITSDFATRATWTCRSRSS